MTDTGQNADDTSKEELRRELRETRSRLRELEAELAETNEGMVALTLELEDAKERYQTIFEESTDAILLIDPDQDTIHEVNRRACELLGYERDALVTLSPRDIFPDEDDRSHTFAEAVVHGWGDGFTCRTKDGRKIDVDISASMVTLDGQSLLLASMRDVTMRIRRQQRLQVLTRIFRHNLRNEGNVIQGHADVLFDELSESPLEENALIIRETIDDILALSNKVRRIQDVLDRDRVQTSPLDELLRSHRDRFQAAYPDATLATETPHSGIIVGRRLGVAVQEAIENAAKHVEKTPAIQITTDVDETAEQVSIHIHDNGPGLPEHELEVISSGTETPLTHGSGIGLWFIYWVVDSLGGSLHIESDGATGTTLTLDVPIVTATNESKLQTDTSSTLPQ